MVNRQNILLLCLCFSVFGLVGCTSAKNLTEEEQDMIAEYSAGVLLQHEEKYEQRLIKQDAAPTQEPTAEPAAVTPVPTVTPASGEESQSEDEEEKLNEISLDQLYHVDGLKVTYDSYLFCKEYPKKSNAFQMTAKKGERLMIVRFNVQNTTSKVLKVNLLKREIGYSLEIDGETYEPTIAIQKNGGLNYLKTSLEPGKSEEAIVVYNIPKEKAEAAKESLVITVRDGDNVSKVQIK